MYISLQYSDSTKFCQTQNFPVAVIRPLFKTQHSSTCRFSDEGLQNAMHIPTHFYIVYHCPLFFLISLKIKLSLSAIIRIMNIMLRNFGGQVEVCTCVGFAGYVFMQVYIYNYTRYTIIGQGTPVLFTLLFPFHNFKKISHSFFMVQLFFSCACLSRLSFSLLSEIPPTKNARVLLL